MSKTHNRLDGHRSSRDDDGDAFLPDPARHNSGARIWAASDAEEFAEEYLASATSAEFAFEDARDELSQDELGGPFVDLLETDRIDPEYLTSPFDDTLESADTYH